jgi:hypothetical protein
MKKIAFIFAIASVLTACSKYEVSDVVSADLLEKATISGVVYIDSDQTNSGLEPAKGATLLFQTGYSTLLTGATGVYTVSTTTNDNGEYSVEFPADDNGVTVSIYGSQIVTDVKKYSGTEKHSFDLESGQTISVYPGLGYVKNLKYVLGGEEFPKVWREATFNVAFKYYNGTENVSVPNGTAIRLDYTNSANKAAYVEANTTGGNATFRIPAREVIDGGTAVSLSSKFLQTINGTPRTFAYSGNFIIYGGVETSKENLIFNY